MLLGHSSVIDFFSFCIKSISMSLRNLCVHGHNYQRAKSSASHLLRNVRLWDMKTLILHNTRMSWGLSLS